MMKLLKISFAVLLAVYVLIAAAGELRTKILFGKTYVRVSDIAKKFRLSFNGSFGNSKKTSYQGKAGSFRFEDNRTQFYFNNLRFEAAYPAVSKLSVFYLSGVDYKYLLEPLLNPGKMAKHRIRRIIIDPGHGGKDKGASGVISHEKNIVLAVAKRTAQILTNCGYQVELVRKRDFFVELPNRSAYQRRRRGELFISLHINSAGDRNVSGIESYSLTPYGVPSSGKATAQKEIYSGNRMNVNNLLLSYYLHKSLLRRTGAVDRGIKRARFVVLRELTCPGVLLELGFISNRREEKLLNSLAYREKLARGIAEGIICYHRSMR